MSVQLPQCLLFDLDGTLLDSLPGIAYSVTAALRAVGLPESPVDLRQMIGPPIRVILSCLAETDDPVLLDELEEHFRKSYDGDGWQKTVCFTGAQEILRMMRRKGHRLFVVSNKPRHISVKILDAAGIGSLFEKIYTRDSRRPPYLSKEEMLRGLLDEQLLAPQDCAMIGDTMEDVSASNMNKIAFILMENGYGNVPAAHSVMLRLGEFSEFLPYLTTENFK